MVDFILDSRQSAVGSRKADTMGDKNMFRPRRNKIARWVWLSLGLNVVFVVTIFLLWREIGVIKQDPAIVSRKEIEDVVDEVSRLIVLPEGVLPTMATVADAEELRKKQTFFAAAENGDKVLLYTNATDPSQRKAYLYRPSTKQLLNVAPVNIGGQIQAHQDVFSIEIRNGTGVDGLAERMGQLVTQVFPNAAVETKSNAVRDDYERSFLVQVNAGDELARKVAAIFNTTIEALPEDEGSPDEVDLLLVLGSREKRGGDQEGE